MFISILVFLLAQDVAFAQPSFIDYQRTYPTVATALESKEDTLRNQFARAGLQWPQSSCIYDLLSTTVKWKSGLEAAMTPSLSFLKPTRYVLWQVLLAQSDWKEITRYRKDSTT
jgi:hypothetical protein